MSEQISLYNGREIRDWIEKNGFDVLSPESGAPRFFQPRFTPAAGPTYLFSVEHTYSSGDGQPMISVDRVFRATSAEDALQQYLRESKGRFHGTGEERVGFRLHLKPGSADREAIAVVKEQPE